jgi:hypothetical protein
MDGLLFASIRLCCLAGSLALTHSAWAASCKETAGPQKAGRYVEECLVVSPATHPPCNAANECSLIQDEIRRGCLLLGRDAPAFCIPYRRPG